MKKAIKLIAIALCFFLIVGCSKFDVLDNSSEFLDSVIFPIVEINENEVRDIQLEEADYEYESNTCYKKLNTRQKEIYKIIYAISEQMPKGFINLGESNNNIVNDIHIAYTAFLNDNVEVFWMPYKYSLGTLKSFSEAQASIAFSYSSNGTSIDYTVTKSQREKMKKLLDSIINNILSGTKNLDSVYEKEKYFNDRLCSRVSYTAEGDFVHTAYGALVNGGALCEGYSRAFKLLCNKAGIECDLISGKADGVGHMWNVVSVDGKYSYVDVTWNDTEGETDYLYFNISGQQLETSHSISPVIDDISPEQINSDTAFNFAKYNCNDISNTYFAKNDLVLDENYVKKASTRISELYYPGNEQISFLLTNKKFLEAIQNDDLSYITNIQKQLKKIRIDAYSLNRDVITFSVCER